MTNNPFQKQLVVTIFKQPNTATTTTNQFFLFFVLQILRKQIHIKIDKFLKGSQTDLKILEQM